jgi:hypothetical protein
MAFFIYKVSGEVVVIFSPRSGLMPEGKVCPDFPEFSKPTIF